MEEERKAVDDATLRACFGRHVGARLLTGPEEIFEDAIEMISGAKECIRATALHEGIIRGGGRNRYIDAIVERLERGRDSGYPVELRIVSYEEIIRNVLGRARIYYQRGLGDFVGIRTTPHSLDAAFLIIDNTCAHLSFSSASPDKTLGTALAFNDTAIVARLAGWFDDHLWRTGRQIPAPLPVDFSAPSAP